MIIVNCTWINTLIKEHRMPFLYQHYREKKVKNMKPQKFFVIVLRHIVSDFGGA